MAKETGFPWKAGSDFILDCESVHEPYRFCVNALEKIRPIIPYDQAVVLMLDANRKIARKHFVDFPRRRAQMYLNHYSKVSHGDFGLSQDVFELEGFGLVNLTDWDKVDGAQDDFIQTYIRPCGVSQTLSFALFDLKGAPATAFALDRLDGGQFTKIEVDAAKLLTAHLSNLYKNLFVRPTAQARMWDGIAGVEGLTPREREVVDLLCQGIRPVCIARELRISLGTTNKHIAHIYAKLGVDSKQEMLVKLLGK